MKKEISMIFCAASQAFLGLAIFPLSAFSGTESASEMEYASGWFWVLIIVFFVLRGFLVKDSEEDSQAAETRKKNSFDFPKTRKKSLSSPPKRKKRVTVQKGVSPESIYFVRQQEEIPFQPIFHENPLHNAAKFLAPIYEAAGRGNLEVVRKNIENGVNVNEPDSFFCETALHRAAKRGYAEIVHLLLQNGANVNALTLPYEETPLHFAITGRNPEVVHLLLKYGANPHAKDRIGRTPAQCAKFYDELQCIFERKAE